MVCGGPIGIALVIGIAEFGGRGRAAEISRRLHRPPAAVSSGVG